MIAKLKGRIESIFDGGLIIDVNGVGYEVLCSARTLASLSVGEFFSLDIITVVREDAFCLYGFLNSADKDWFSTLLSVQGVGAKVALAIQSVLGAQDLYNAVASGDKTAFSLASGVGSKLASRIVLELKDKIAKISIQGTGIKVTHSAHGQGGDSDALLQDATSALVNLGFTHSLAFSAVSHIMREKVSETMDMDTVIPLALKKLKE